jgi:tetratricopeptide (TPR) repeat protein
VYSANLDMHPELLNNSLFLRYYKQWQDQPASVVFAPIAEFLLLYGMIDDAFKVCRQGLVHHPELVTGRLAMAKIHLRRGNWEEAELELNRVFAVVPENAVARALKGEIAARQRREQEGETSPAASAPFPEPEGAFAETPSSWETLTMAGIFAAQGHHERARQIYQTILRRDPGNELARSGLAALPPAG